MGKRYWRSNAIHFNQCDTILRPVDTPVREYSSRLKYLDLLGCRRSGQRPVGVFVVLHLVAQIPPAI
jgi:hypothetical protein